MTKIKMPVEYNGKPTEPITGFSVGPDGDERESAIRELFRNDPELKNNFFSDVKRLRDRANAQIHEELDTEYDLHPGETLELPEDHAQLMLDTYGFLERVEEEAEFEQVDTDEEETNNEED